MKIIWIESIRKERSSVSGIQIFNFYAKTLKEKKKSLCLV